MTPRARLIRTLYRSGVGLLAGTDLAPYPGGFPGYALHNELTELVGIGLAPIDAIRAATLNPARYFAADSMGSLRVGNVADLARRRSSGGHQEHTIRGSGCLTRTLDRSRERMTEVEVPLPRP